MDDTQDAFRGGHAGPGGENEGCGHEITMAVAASSEHQSQKATTFAKRQTIALSWKTA